MKWFFLVFLASFFSVNLAAQDYLEEIAKNSCSCCTEISDTISFQMQTIQFGLCMIDAAMPYKKKFKRDFGLDLDKLDESSEQIGSIIAIQMMEICPDFLLDFYDKYYEEEAPPAETEVDYTYYAVSGTVIGIEKDFFVTFSLKDDAGKINKYYWFSYLESGFNLIEEYNNLIGDTVTIQYDFIELFDPRINEYRQFRVIKSIDLYNFSE
jgi:hypothetical protein